MSVSLSKGQKISLEKGGSGLKEVVMGLGWDAKETGGFFGFGKRQQDIDLDASAVLFDAQKQKVDEVWFRQLRSRDGSVIHTGDNRTGAGDGDDEQIIVDLSQVPGEVSTIVFVVNSFTGENFSQIENAFCRLVDKSSGEEIARFDLSAQGNHTAQIMTKVYREGSGWQFQAIGQNASGRTFDNLMPSITPHL